MSKQVEPSPEDMLPTAAAAKVLGVQPGTLNQWRWRGSPEAPPYFRVGGRTIRYRRSDLAAYLEKNSPTAQTTATVGGQQ